MNVIKSGNSYHIHDDIPEIYETIPNGTYEINFHKMAGFYLTKRDDLVVKENKIYGNTNQKVDKILNSFARTDRNFGVILSGPKGVGKSLFARSLAQRANERNLPLLLCTTYVPGIASFISSISQEVIVLFDEFEKTFAETEDTSPQDEMLSLFDGIDSGKKMFVITCNKIERLSDYLLNRPGRFHYHFVLGNPTPAEISAYMADKLEPQYHNLISKVIALSFSGNLTYDCLRAIAFELNNGYSLEETIGDLNISRETYLRFDITIEFEDGTIVDRRDCSINLSNPDTAIWFPAHPGSFQLCFDSTDLNFDSERNIIKLDKAKATLHYDDEELEDNGLDEEQREKYKKRNIKNIIFVRVNHNDVYRYVVAD